MNLLSPLLEGRFGAYVAAAYGISGVGLLTLTVWTLARGAYWRRRSERAAPRRRPR